MVRTDKLPCSGCVMAPDQNHHRRTHLIFLTQQRCQVAIIIRWLYLSPKKVIVKPTPQRHDFRSSQMQTRPCHHQRFFYSRSHYLQSPHFSSSIHHHVVSLRFTHHTCPPRRMCSHYGNERTGLQQSHFVGSHTNSANGNKALRVVVAQSFRLAIFHHDEVDLV